ncbi:MAG TPA: malto-oligosyltrehalose synthase [Mycobacteriales bacterium]
MRPPVPRPVLSTYRLQVHAGFDLHAAASVVDYLAALGVDHVYTSPLLQAMPGSLHGYDVADATRVSAEFGGEPGRQALADAARTAGLGTVVDIVPNHMGVAVAEANPWWWDVLRHGRASAYARYFDIDWSAPRIALPVLGDAPDETRHLTVDGNALVYFDHRFPLAPGTGEGTPEEVHARQHYELVSWRSGRLGYRRFFTVTDLAGVRQEDLEVFAATHREVLRWVRAGDVDGLRVDHPDGMADPQTYLRRLAAEAPGTWIVVEKILGPDEELDPSLPVAGTTGYDALREVSGAFVDPAGEDPLSELHLELTGQAADAGAVAEAEHESKRHVALTSLRPELERIAALVCPRDDARRPEVVGALAELMAGLPVYRTDYSHLRGVLRGAVASAVRRRPDLERELTLVAEALEAAGEAATRFHQTCGAVTAKGLEDRLFYRTARLVALNEVGGDPARFGVSPAEFHLAASGRARSRPTAMTALSTHDTKRGEDVRARLAVLAEIPRRWASEVREWNAAAPPPEPVMGYLLWQTFVGVWPVDGPPPAERLHAYAEKAAREAGLATTWEDPDPDHEKALHAWIDTVCSGPVGESVGAFAASIAPFGWSNALGQKLVQLTSPGVPDVYQGTELWDDSLVDPDNRRPVDYDIRRELLAELDSGLAVLPPVDATGAAKLLVTSRALRLRRERPDVFAGTYHPLPTGRHLLGFLRGAYGGPRDAAVAVLATRLPAGLAARDGWTDETVGLPGGRWTDRLTGVTHEVSGGRLRIADVLDALPVALLVREDA